MSSQRNLQITWYRAYVIYGYYISAFVIGPIIQKASFVCKNDVLCLENNFSTSVLSIQCRALGVSVRFGKQGKMFYDPVKLS